MQGARELRVKESDRIAVMVDGLQQLGIEAVALEDGALINGGRLHGGVVDSQHDHRIAMAFSVAGAIAEEPVVIKDCHNIKTSFPNFIQVAQQANMKVKELDDDFL